MKKIFFAFLFFFLGAFVLLSIYGPLTNSTSSKDGLSFKSRDEDPAASSNISDNSEHSPLADILSKCCDAEGVEFEIVKTLSAPPEIPDAFHNEAVGPWPKVIGKLEARYGVVPVYDKEDPEFSKPPRSVKIIGRFLYFGKNSREIDALKLLVDGDAALRSQALDTFEDGDSHAVPLFLALQARDEDAQIRIEATQRLQFFDSARVVDATIAALGDSDEAVQAAARSTLVLIGSERVLQGVRMAVNSPNPRISEMALSILQDNLER